MCLQKLEPELICMHTKLTARIRPTACKSQQLLVPTVALLGHYCLENRKHTNDYSTLGTPVNENTSVCVCVCVCKLSDSLFPFRQVAATCQWGNSANIWERACEIATSEPSFHHLHYSSDGPSSSCHFHLFSQLSTALGGGALSNGTHLERAVSITMTRDYMKFLCYSDN